MGTFTDLRAFRSKFRGVPTSAPLVTRTNVVAGDTDDSESEEEVLPSPAQSPIPQFRSGQPLIPGIRSNSRQNLTGSSISEEDELGLLIIVLNSISLISRLDSGDLPPRYQLATVRSQYEQECTDE